MLHSFQTGIFKGVLVLGPDIPISLLARAPQNSLLFASNFEQPLLYCDACFQGKNKVKSNVKCFFPERLYCRWFKIRLSRMCMNIDVCACLPACMHLFARIFLLYLLDVVQRVDLGRKAPVHTEELLVHQGCQGQAIKRLHAGVVHLLRVLDLT